MPDSPPAALRETLTRTVRGDVRFDKLTRAIYATDASIYQMTPLGVVMPKSADDVVATVHACREHGVSITPRGAGTGLTGAAVGPGMQIDFSRHMNRILNIDTKARTVRVQPGVVLDELNAELGRLGFQFAVDVATSSRATLGGMAANNSCGAHSILYGRTVDQILEMTTVLADGSVAVWNRRGLADGSAQNGSLAGGAMDVLARVGKEYRSEILDRYPKVLRSNGGYALDRLIARAPEMNPIGLLSGSEGTLCLITEMLLQLTPLPKAKGLLVLHFHELMEALACVAPMLDHKPAAVELVDKLILDAARTNPIMAARANVFLEGDPTALIIVELFDDDP
ncbi:MAG: FAD-binding oxidoreductase, partial [Phycisphaerae bacterium]|nr:FAD-binding oxidoreductase [Phycisphaerae bacterium]